MSRPTVVFLVIVLATSTSSADVLLLEGGGRVEGEVKERGEKLLVTSIHGSVLVRREDVVDRVRARYVTEVYADRRARTDSRDPDALSRLSTWCEAHGLDRRAADLRKEILALDPDHAPTRKRLGQVHHDGVWMTPRQAEDAEMAALGMVRYRGVWMTKKGLAEYLALQSETAAIEKVAAKRKAAREEEERKAREAAEAAGRRAAGRRAAGRRAAGRRAAEEAAQREAERERERERLEDEVDDLKDLVRILLLRDSDPYRGGSLGLPCYGIRVGGRWGYSCRPVAVPYRLRRSGIGGYGGSGYGGSGYGGSGYGGSGYGGGGYGGGGLLIQRKFDHYASPTR